MDIKEMGWKVYGNALHVLELLCKYKSMPKNNFKSQQKQKNKGKKCGPQISSIYTTWKLASSEDDQNPLQTGWISLHFSEDPLNLWIIGQSLNVQ